MGNLKFAFALASLVALVHSPAAATQSTGRDTLRRPIPRVASMDPIRAASVSDSQAVALAYETPLEVDYFARPYRLAPNLCELPEWSDDGRTCTMKVRPGHRFRSDAAIPGGRAVTAHDVVYSLKRLGDKANASPGAWLMRDVESIEAVDAETVRIVLKSPLYVFSWYLAMPYTAAVPREAVERYGNAFGSMSVGSGPYNLVHWRRNHSMVYKRNRAHPFWQGVSSPIETICFYVIDDPATQFLMFLNGELDILSELSQDCREAVMAKLASGGLSALASGEPATVELAPGRVTRVIAELPLVTFYMGMNLRDKTLGGMGERSKFLRQALNCAFDFAAWSRFRQGSVAESASPVPPGVPGRLETPFAYSHNEAKAVELLEKAGYNVSTDPATGRRQTIDPATGRRLSLTYTLGRAAQQDREEAEFLKSFYDKVGIDLELKFMTWTSFLQAVDEGRVQLFRMGWAGDYPDAENFMQIFLRKNLPPGPNHTAYSNPAFDEIYDKALLARTPAEREALWLAAQEIIREDCPWVFLYHPKRFSLVSPQLENYLPGDFSYGMEKYMHFH